MNTEVQITKFENLLKVFSAGHYFVYKEAENLWKLYRINNAEALFYKYEVELAPNQTVTISEKDLSLLIPPKGQMYGFTIAVKGNVSVIISQPPAVPRFGAGSVAGEITEDIASLDELNPLIFVVTLPDQGISLQVKNLTDVTQKATIYFIGAKYTIMELAEIRGWTPEGVIVNITNKNFPTNVIREMIELWKYGKLPEILTTAVTK